MVSDLQQCVVIDDAGIRLIRVSGSRSVSHKLKYHELGTFKIWCVRKPFALTSDASVEDVDYSKIRGYVCKWIDPSTC